LSLENKVYQEAEMSTVTEIIHKLRSMDNKRVLQAIEELRVRGWLEDGSLANVPLCHVHMQGADLLSAKLVNIDFHQADLSGADLRNADLTNSKLNRSNLTGANLSKANLSNVDMFKANLKNALNLTSEQLSQAKRLYGATMPDGNIYDGRYNLHGDLEFARWGRVNVDDPQAMADFLGVSLETYLEGQGKLVAAAS
jgi:uncharacterized protein YjbI with pentapeptide repeats